ncbi:MAG: VOC family protein [Deltaproteobacteria bacterium]|nr:VOC family protein [Deltaproteobacteria bacterium]
MPHAISWFEIPTTDFARARTFYEAMLGTTLMPMEAPGRKMAAFPADWSKGEISGCIVQGQGAQPAATGTLIFLNCDPDLAAALGRVVKAGGKIVLPKTEIPMQGAGHMAIITDTEGNSIGLHSAK